MTDRIDHAKEAERALAKALNENWPEFVPVAQVHATLALVEQMRIANLIALRGARGGELREGLLFTDNPDNWGELNPDIAAALGIEVSLDD